MHIVWVGGIPGQPLVRAKNRRVHANEIEQIAVRVQYRQLTQVTKLFVRFEAPQRRELLIRDESSRIPRTWLESWYDGGSAALNGIIKSRDKEIITNAIQIERAKHHRQ